MNEILVKPYLNGYAPITKNFQAKQAILCYKRKHPCVYTMVNRTIIHHIYTMNINEGLLSDEEPYMLKNTMMQHQQSFQTIFEYHDRLKNMILF
jgi:hypothetical protein